MIKGAVLQLYLASYHVIVHCNSQTISTEGIKDMFKPV